MRKRTAACLVGVLALAWPAAGAASAQAATAGAASLKTSCAHQVSSADLTRGLGSMATVASTAQTAAAAATKQQLGTPVTAISAANAATEARKEAMVRSSQSGSVGPVGCGTTSTTGASPRIVRPYTTGAGYSYLSDFAQYGEATNSFCGPATVASISATTPGPSPVNLNQYTVANYLASDVGGDWHTIDSRGTNTNEEVNGLNHFVGTPDFGWNYYSWVDMADNPTSGQRGAFVADLKFDVSKGTPIAGDAWEVPGGPHLVGHPNQTIFHYISIGGWNDNTSQVWYADPATSVWPATVPRFSWFDTYTMETILGGRGFIW